MQSIRFNIQNPWIPIEQWLLWACLNIEPKLNSSMSFFGDGWGDSIATLVNESEQNISNLLIRVNKIWLLYALRFHKFNFDFQLINRMHFFLLFNYYLFSYRSSLESWHQFWQRNLKLQINYWIKLLVIKKQHKRYPMFSHVLKIYVLEFDPLYML